VPETVRAIVDAHRARASTPEDTVARSFARIRTHGDAAVFITLRDEGEALAEARALTSAGPGDLPLYGVPVAVKDNIDVKGLPTTAACPAFAYEAAHDATAVARLRRAGAIVVGKTNLDQFAAGLVGVRSPYGIPRNALDAALIPGGSSSGSAVAVAAGLVPLALGTDTAGSGRVPAMLNNIVGFKPSLGLISTYGVVPACRTLDCVSVFALTVDDAWLALETIAGVDRNDAYSRDRPLGALGEMPSRFVVGVPRVRERVFFGDGQAATNYEAALARLARLGGTIVEIEIEPFYETARLLYEGPWLAERYAVVRSLLASAPGAMHPVTREIIVDGAKSSAVDAFTAFYRLEELRRVVEHTLGGVDLLALPTAPTVYTVEQVLADPIRLNSRLGAYTNFVNLLDLCGLALPAALDERRPFGITLLARGGSDARLASIGRAFHADTALPLGAIAARQPPLATLDVKIDDDRVRLAVVGAHLSGMALNHELHALGARLIDRTSTAPDYRLYALAGSAPPKPGLLRVAQGQGAATEVEVWELSHAAFGRFVAAVPPPLSIGTVRLSGGRGVKGFLVEAEAIVGAADISHFGGWRTYMAQSQPA
jgi:allophanate hydrolase